MALRRLAAAAPVIAAAWAAYNGVLYAADAARRYRAEAAWFIFAAALVTIAIYALARASRTVPKSELPDTRTLIIGGAAFVSGALLLYWPILSIGLLSDDFILLSRARSGALIDPAWEFVRPLPLALWRLAGAPLALHVLNVVLHGVNASLTAILALRYGLSKTAAAFAGLLFLVFPSSVEAVTWAAGVFDVMLVTLVLGSCVALTGMSNGGRRTITIALLTAAALATKETAVVTPAILIVACVGASRKLRDAAIPIAVSFGLVAAYVAVRAIAGFASAPPSQDASGYVVKEFLGRPFATLGLPFHLELLAAHRWIAYVFALFWPLILGVSAMQWPSDRATATRIMSCAAWILVSVLPVAAMLFIAGDLQGSRYVYLGTAAFSIMVLAVAANFDQAVQMLVAIPLIALFAVSARSHQSAWTAAARERDRVLDAYQAGAFNCVPASVRGLPDNVRGAYVFRNGFIEAVSGRAAAAARTCELAWDGARFKEAR